MQHRPRELWVYCLNGTDASGSNAGDNIDMEDAHDIDTARLITEGLLCISDW